MLLHVNYVQSTCTECMSCYVMLCYMERERNLTVSGEQAFVGCNCNVCKDN